MQNYLEVQEINNGPFGYDPIPIPESWMEPLALDPGLDPYQGGTIIPIPESWAQEQPMYPPLQPVEQPLGRGLLRQEPRTGMPDPSYRVGIDPVQPGEWNNGPYDPILPVQLASGQLVALPSPPGTVSVGGSVTVPTVATLAREPMPVWLKWAGLALIVYLLVKK